MHGHPLVYFDNAATTQKPTAVVDALKHYYEHDNANVHRGIHELSNRATTAFEAARQRAAQFINARSSDEIIFTRGTTEGINLIAYAWGTKQVLVYGGSLRSNHFDLSIAPRDDVRNEAGAYIEDQIHFNDKVSFKCRRLFALI